MKKLETWTMRAIIAEAFFLALSPSLAAVAVLFGTVTWVLRLQIDNRFKFRSLAFDLPASIFALISLISIFCSSSRSLELIYNYCTFVGIYGLTYILVGQNVRTRQQVKELVLALGASALLVVLWGYFQYVFGIDTIDMKWVDPEKFPELKKRVFSTLENPNVLAGYLDVLICLALGVLAKVRGHTQRFALIVAIAMLAACLAMTYSRGAYLTMIVVFIICGVIQDWRLLLFFALLTAGILYYDAAFVDRLLSIFTATDSSEGLRIGIWISTFAMIADHPFIGIGWGAFKSIYPSYDYYLKGANVEVYHAHNIFLHQAAEIGIIGAMAFFWYFFGTMLMALELGANKKFLAIKNAIIAVIERVSGIEFKRKIIETKDEVKERYLIENGRLEQLVGMKERTADKVADASDKFIDWISYSSGEDETEGATEDGADKVSLVKKVSLKKKISLKKTKRDKNLTPTPKVEDERVADKKFVDKAVVEDRSPSEPTVEDKKISATVKNTPLESEGVEGATEAEEKKFFDWNEVAEINNRQVADGVKFGIGLAFMSMALNGLTDDLLFNIPSSMLMWMLGALGGAIALLPEDDTKRRKKF